MRKTVMSFLEYKYIANFILGMVILLCIVIFMELSFQDQITSNESLETFFYFVDIVLLSFFMVVFFLDSADCTCHH